MTAPLALCLTLQVLGAPPALDPRPPSLAPRLSLAEPAAAAELPPVLPPVGPQRAPPPGREGSFAKGWGAAAGATLAGDVVAGAAVLLLVRPGEWALQRWVGSLFSEKGGSSVMPFLVVTAIVVGAGVLWGALPPTFALAGARRGVDAVPSPRTRTLTFLAHLAAGLSAVRLAEPRTPAQAFAAVVGADLLVVPLVAAGLTARDAASALDARARPERDPALALAR